jgi:hypothetical protein
MKKTRMLMGNIGTVLLVMLSRAYAADGADPADDGSRPLRIEVRKQPRSADLYEVASFEEKKDISGKKHDVCNSEGVAFVGKQGLVQQLAAAFGYKYYGPGAISQDPTEWPDYAQKRVGDFIKKVDAGELGFRLCKPLQFGEKTIRVEPLHLKDREVYDQQGKTVAWLGRQDPGGVWHYYNLIFCVAMKDIGGEDFLAIDHTKLVSKEELLGQQADFEKKIASPLVDDFNAKRMKQELSSIRLFLQKIASVESNPVETPK